MPFIRPRIKKKKESVIVARKSVIGSDFEKPKIEKKEEEEEEPLQSCMANNNPYVNRAVPHCICSIFP